MPEGGIPGAASGDRSVAPPPGGSTAWFFALKPETVALMWTSQRTTSGEETGYGIGWFTGTVDGHREVWHTGGAVGGSTILLIRPDDHVVVAILTNLENARPTRPARDIAGLFAAARPQTGNR